MGQLEKQEKKMREELNERTVKTAQDIIFELNSFVSEKGITTAESREKIVEHYDILVKKCIEVLLSNKTKLSEINYVFGTIEGVLSHVRGYIETTNKTYSQVIDEKVFGIKGNELTIADLVNKASELTVKKDK